VLPLAALLATHVLATAMTLCHKLLLFRFKKERPNRSRLSRWQFRKAAGESRLRLNVYSIEKFMSREN
jgi:hypothetical protein